MNRFDGIGRTVSHLPLKDIQPYTEGQDHIRSEDISAFIISISDHRCYEGIEIKVQDIAPELTAKNQGAEPKH
jgi:hypothetical protein